MPFAGFCRMEMKNPVPMLLLQIRERANCLRPVLGPLRKKWEKISLDKKYGK